MATGTQSLGPANALAKSRDSGSSTDWEPVRSLSAAITEDYLSPLTYDVQERSYTFRSLTSYREKGRASSDASYRQNVAEFASKMSKADSCVEFSSDRCSSKGSFQLDALPLEIQTMIVQYAIALPNRTVTVQYIPVDSTALQQAEEGEADAFRLMSVACSGIDGSLARRRHSWRVRRAYLTFRALCLTSPRLRTLAIQTFFSDNRLMAWSPSSALMFMRQLPPLYCIQIRALVLFIARLDGVSVAFTHKLRNLRLRTLRLVLSQDTLLRLGQASCIAQLGPGATLPGINAVYVLRNLRSLKGLENFHVQHCESRSVEHLRDNFPALLFQAIDPKPTTGTVQEQEASERAWFERFHAFQTNRRRVSILDIEADVRSRGRTRSLDEEREATAKVQIRNRWFVGLRPINDVPKRSADGVRRHRCPSVMSGYEQYYSPRRGYH